jgi:hypothetical protein
MKKEVNMQGQDDWICDQEVEYTLVAKVNGEVAYKMTTSDSEIIESDLLHAEEQVAQLLNEQYIDAMTPDYDAMAQEERMYTDV